MKKPVNHKGRNTGQKSFIMVRHDIFDSYIWKTLSPPARIAWLEIMRRHNGYNNGDIAMACTELARHTGVSKNTASRALKQLIEAGFIKVAIPSGFQNKTRRATRYIITHEPFNKTPPTNEWRKVSQQLAKENNSPTTLPPWSHKRDAHLCASDYSAI